MTDRYQRTTAPLDVDSDLPDRSRIAVAIEELGIDGKYRRVLLWMLDRQWPADSSPDQRFGHRALIFNFDMLAGEFDWGRNKAREVVRNLIEFGFVIRREVPGDDCQYFPIWGKLFGATMADESAGLQHNVAAPALRCEAGATHTIAVGQERGPSTSLTDGMTDGSGWDHPEPSFPDFTQEASYGQEASHRRPPVSEASHSDRRPPVAFDVRQTHLQIIASLTAQLQTAQRVIEQQAVRLAQFEAAHFAKQEASHRQEASDGRPPKREASYAPFLSIPRAGADARLVKIQELDKKDKTREGIFGGKKKRDWRWHKWPLSKADLTGPMVVKLYQDVVLGAGWGKSREDRLAFYALCLFCAREGKNPGAYLTDCVIENCRTYPSEEDLRRAELAISREERLMNSTPERES